MSSEAEIAAKKLVKMDEDVLYEELGKRAKAIAGDPRKSSYFDLDVKFDSELMGPLDEVRNFGRKLFDRWSRDLYELICGAGQQSSTLRNDFASALGIGETAAIAALSAFIVSFGLAPAIAAVIAAIVIKLFWKSAIDEFCKEWKDHL